MTVKHVESHEAAVVTLRRQLVTKKENIRIDGPCLALVYNRKKRAA